MSSRRRCIHSETRTLRHRHLDRNTQTMSSRHRYIHNNTSSWARARGHLNRHLESDNGRGFACRRNRHQRITPSFTMSVREQPRFSWRIKSAFAQTPVCCTQPYITTAESVVVLMPPFLPGDVVQSRCRSLTQPSAQGGSDNPSPSGRPCLDRLSYTLSSEEEHLDVHV